MKTVKIYNTLKAHVILNDYDEYNDYANTYEEELKDCLYMENKDNNLIKYCNVPGVHDIELSVEWYDGILYGVAVCTVDDDWNKEKELKEYLTGQYADGWGESFEQSPITSFTTLERFEDEDGEEFYEYVNNDVYINFYQLRNYKIMTSDELMLR